MATTTPNFGWSVPTSTDLVKDGATAIETLGDAIDASLVDLKGGTTGQILSKNSNTDMDFTWVSDATGMTNPMTTTGDTIYSSSGSTPARLGIGTTGQVLTVSGGLPAWATPASGGMTVLASGSLSGASLDLTSISQSYVDLKLVLLGYAPVTNTGYAQLRLNNDSNTRYTSTSDNNPTTFNTFGGTRIDLSDGMSNTATFQSSVIDIPNYTNAAIWKTTTSDTVYTSTADGSNTKWRRGQIFGLYNQTAAITQITITPTGGFVSQGTYVLYGVK